MSESAPQPGRLKRCLGWFLRHWHWLKWPAALALLGCLFYANRKSLDDLSERTLRWEFAAIAFLLCLGAILLTFVRWYLLVWAQEFDFSLKEAVQLGFLGYVSNYVAPGAVGGDLVKAAVLAGRQSSRRAVAVATIVLDRLLGLLALFIVGGGVWLLQSEEMRGGWFLTVAAVFAGGSAAGLAGLIAMLHTPLFRAGWFQRLVKLRLVGRLIGELITAVVLYQSRPRVIWASVAISLFGHLVMLSSFYFAALTVNEPGAVPDYFAHLLFMPAAELAGMIPLFPGGVGALEAMTGEFYRLAGYQRLDGVLTAVCYRVVTIVIAVLGTGYYLAGRRRVREALNADPSLEP